MTQSDDSYAGEKQALLKRLTRMKQKRAAQRFSLKTANPAVLDMLNDPNATLAFLQECGIYDEHGELTEHYP